MAFQFRLVNEDGTPVDPPTLQAAAPDWCVGDTIPLARDKTLRVIEVRPGMDPEQEPVLVVEPA